MARKEFEELSNKYELPHQLINILISDGGNTLNDLKKNIYQARRYIKRVNDTAIELSAIPIVRKYLFQGARVDYTYVPWRIVLDGSTRNAIVEFGLTIFPHELILHVDHVYNFDQVDTKVTKTVNLIRHIPSGNVLLTSIDKEDVWSNVLPELLLEYGHYLDSQKSKLISKQERDAKFEFDILSILKKSESGG